MLFTYVLIRMKIVNMSSLNKLPGYNTNIFVDFYQSC